MHALAYQESPWSNTSLEMAEESHNGQDQPRQVQNNVVRPSEAWKDNIPEDLPDAEADIMKEYGEAQFNLDPKWIKLKYNTTRTRDEMNACWGNFLKKLVDMGLIKEGMTTAALKKWVACKKTQYNRWCHPPSGSAVLSESDLRLKKVRRCAHPRVWCRLAGKCGPMYVWLRRWRLPLWQMVARLV